LSCASCQRYLRVCTLLRTPLQTFALLSSFVRAMYGDTIEGTEAIPRSAAATPATTSSDAKRERAFAVSGGFAVPAAQPPRRTLRVSGGLVTLTHAPPDRVILTWSSSPLADMVADSLVAVLSQVCGLIESSVYSDSLVAVLSQVRGSTRRAVCVCTSSTISSLSVCVFTGGRESVCCPGAAHPL
jgi:hypothetical protein